MSLTLQTTRTFHQAIRAASVIAGVALITGGATPARAAGSPYTQYRGVDDFGSFGLDSTSFASHGGDMKAWGVDIVREDVPYFDSIPFGTGSTTISGQTVHGLQAVVNDIDTNVGASTIQILCPFSWNTSANANNVALSGATPSDESFFSAYKSRLASEATQFKSQSNVWLELWNEPFATADPMSGGTSQWVADMESMIGSVRTGTGYTGKIVVPAADYSGDETTILKYGQTISSYDPDHNVVFDLHAYSNFITGNEAAEQSRLQTIVNSGNNVLFGEVGPAVLGTSNVQDVSTFVTALQDENLTGIAWNWNDGDDNTLHDSNSSLNNTTANNNWATQWYNYTSGSAAALPEPSALEAGVIVCGGLMLRKRPTASHGNDA